MTIKKVALIIPSLKNGGMERVITVLANNMALDATLEIHLISLNKLEPFYRIDSSVKTHFITTSKNPFIIIYLLRKSLKLIKPEFLISFGAMYNSFNIFASLGLNIKIFVSDRSNPYRNTYFTLKKGGVERHDGVIHFFLKRVLYQFTAGILVQTKTALKIEKNTLKHNNIIYFPNPVSRSFFIDSPENNRENIILNVGRFIDSKCQKDLVEIFDELKLPNWKLVFVGDGPTLSATINYAKSLQSSKNIFFEGAQKDVSSYYKKSKIFAFTSISEGFPNSLAEACASGLPLVSYDCVAGPSDIIENNSNGYLIDEKNKATFRDKLFELINNPELCVKFANKSKEIAMKNFREETVINDLKNKIFLLK